MDVSDEARRTKAPNLLEILERMEMVAFAWLEETASTRAQ